MQRLRGAEHKEYSDQMCHVSEDFCSETEGSQWLTELAESSSFQGPAQTGRCDDSRPAWRSKVHSRACLNVNETTVPFPNATILSKNNLPFRTDPSSTAAHT
ncbi:hypothetical protein JZ751_008764 [Albula glossodonta]|uniref:Uncharacterized protein n=1 Tax=Albula glossodonta TaxID=121402 RepID=A0A8T2P1N5_9TELE|nr:hypothetical protein JZ751_008764 [Albula glossodonta]